MFKRIHVENFRSIGGITLDNLSPVVALIGKNGAGKTNILKSFEWAARVAATTGVTAEAIWPPRGLQFDVQIGGEIFRYKGTTARIGDPGASQAIQLQETVLVGPSETELVPLLERNGEGIDVPRLGQKIQTAPFTPAIQVLSAVLPPSEPVAEKLKALSLFLDSVRYYPLDEPADPAAIAGTPYVTEADYNAWATQYRERGLQNDDVRMRLVYLFKEDRSKFDDLASMLGQDQLGLFHGIQVTEHEISVPVSANEASEKSGSAGPPRKQRLFYPIFQISPMMAVGYGLLSAGTRRVLRMVLSLVFDKSSVMLLEQPEDSIHSGLLKQLIPLIRDLAECQVIMASHSPTVLNLLESSEVRLVTMENGVSSVRALTTDEIKQAADFITSQGTLSDFLRIAVQPT